MQLAAPSGTDALSGMFRAVQRGHMRKKVDVLDAAATQELLKRRGLDGIVQHAQQQFSLQQSEDLLPALLLELVAEFRHG